VLESFSRKLFMECMDSIPKFSPDMIGALFVGQMSGMFEHQEHNAPIYLEWCGLDGGVEWC